VLRGDNLQVPTLWKYGSLNVLEPPGPVHANKEIALPLIPHVESDLLLPPELYPT